MNCDDVPCWWGAIPGMTSVGEVKYAMSPYNFYTYEYAEDGELVHLLLGIGYVEERNDFAERVAYNFADSTLVGVTAYSPSISEFLSSFGQPDEVWLSTVSHVRDGFLAVRLNLVYFQKGMAVGYVVNGKLQDGVVVGCFANEESGRLRLSIPNSATSYRDFSPIFEKDRRYLLLEEATGLTMAGFMQQFGDPTQSQCIETPTELWD